MGAIRKHRPVLLISAVFSRHEEALSWSRATLEAAWGAVALESPRFRFHETQFYERTMGPEIEKYFLAFERLVDPARLPEIKIQTNDWEDQYKAARQWPEERPLNLDPGYLTEAKLVLASTKDRDHRLYLDRGIFAEETLYYQQGGWKPREWTYPDYLRPDYHDFFMRCRNYLRQRYQGGDTL